MVALFGPVCPQPEDRGISMHNDPDSDPDPDGGSGDGASVVEAPEWEGRDLPSVDPGAAGTAISYGRLCGYDRKMWPPL